MIDVSHHIVEGYFIHRELINKKEDEEAKAAQHTDKRKPYDKIQYANSGQGKHLLPSSNLKEHSGYAKNMGMPSMLESSSLIFW